MIAALRRILFGTPASDTWRVRCPICGDVVGFSSKDRADDLAFRHRAATGHPTSVKGD